MYTLQIDIVVFSYDLYFVDIRLVEKFEHLLVSLFELVSANLCQNPLLAVKLERRVTHETAHHSPR
jgi:hypothetical protein